MGTPNDVGEKIGRRRYSDGLSLERIKGDGFEQFTSGENGQEVTCTLSFVGEYEEVEDFLKERYEKIESKGGYEEFPDNFLLQHSTPGGLAVDAAGWLLENYEALERKDVSTRGRDYGFFDDDGDLTGLGEDTLEEFYRGVLEDI